MVRGPQFVPLELFMMRVLPGALRIQDLADLADLEARSPQWRHVPYLEAQNGCKNGSRPKKGILFQHNH